MKPETDPYDSEMPYIPPSRWPMTFGIVSIVFGVFGLLISLVKIAQTLMFGSGIMGKVYGSGTAQSKELTEMTNGVFSAMEEAAPKILISEGALVVLALLLIAGGVLLLMRRRVATWVIQVWAFSKIIGGGFAAYLGWQVSMKIQQEMFAKMAAGSSTGVPPPTHYIEAMYTGLFIVKVVWLAALPIFFLVWLNREAIKDDLKDGVWK